MNILYWLTAKQIYHLPFIKEFRICLEKTFKEANKKILYTLLFAYGSKSKS